MRYSIFKNTIRNISFAIVLLIGLSFISCQDTLFDDVVEAQIDESNLMDARIAVKVNELNVNSLTREAEPSDNPEKATDQEKKVDDIWVFQYDTSGNLLIKPRYYIASESETEDGIWNVTLKSDKESYIYVVTNTQDNTWASNYESFSTIDKLKKEKLSDPRVIVFDSSTNDEYIPMEGVTEEIVVPSTVGTIEVPVTRMYAKLKIKIKLAEILDDYYNDVEVSYVNVERIPYYCRVASLADDESAEGAVAFPTDTEFQSRAFLGVEPDDDDEDYYPYVLYVPENLQGESENVKDSPEEKGSTTDTPQDAISITARITFKNKDDDEELTVLYVVYPGGNNYNNFNIRRNDVYRVILDVGYPLEETPEPSANCICGFAGETLVFYPYYREEIGGNGSSYYDFSSYLDPEDEDKRIDYLKIIWQTENCIGDNSLGDKVYITRSDYQSDPIKQYKIYVKTAYEGNALIGAYNKNDDIIWSWHIWVRDKDKETDPTNIANAMTYYTYDWDSNGIYPENARILGYPIMNCNVGALSDDLRSTSSSDFQRTLGVLYQWGRKDPFPPGKASNLTYAYDEEHMKIIVYDNEHEKINMTNNDGCVGDGDGYKVFNTILANNVEGYESKANADVLKYTIQNPTIFIATYTKKATAYTDFNEPDYYIDGSQCDWLPVQDDYLWGGTDNYTMSYTAYSLDKGDTFTATLRDNFGDNKTIFDPCPYGWRVSPGDIWVGYTSTGKNTGSITSDPYYIYDKINCSEQYGSAVYTNHGYHLYMQGWHKGQTSFFPIQGTRQPSGQMQGYLGCGNYHNATAEKDPVDIRYSSSVTYPSFNRRVDILHIHGESNNFFINTFDNQLRYTNRTIGCPIRCVRETK